MAKTLKKQPATRKKNTRTRKRKRAEVQRRYREKKKQSGEPVKKASPEDKAKQLEQLRQRQRRFKANKKASEESKEKAQKPFSESLPVKFASPKPDSKGQACPGKVRAISLPEKGTLIKEPLFLPNGKINNNLTRWIVVRAEPDYNQQPNFKFGDPITCRNYRWRETEQWSREPLNCEMSFGEAARAGKPKSLRRCHECGLAVSANEEDHKEECVKVIKQREKKIKKLRKTGEPEYLIRWHRKNWAGLCRNAVTDPVQKRKPDAGPKWYEFKVVPLSNKYYNILHAPRPPSSYLMRPLMQ